MSTADQLAQALRGLLETDGFMPRPPRDGENHNRLLAAWQNAHAALANHEAEKDQEVLPNGLTEAETAASASVLGLMLPKKAAPAAPVAGPLTYGDVVAALRKIAMAARTSKSTHGHVDGLIQACEEAEAIIARHNQRVEAAAARWGVKLEGDKE